MGNSSCCSNAEADKHDSEDFKKGAAPVVLSDAHMAEEVDSSSQADMTANTPSNEFRITLDKSTGLPLGVDVDHQDGKTLLIDAVTEGLVSQWNAQNSDREVKRGDRIVEVCGARGDVMKLVAECKQNKVLEMVVARN